MDAETSLDSSVMQKENTGLPPTKTDGVRPLIHRSILKEKSDLSEMIWKQTKKSLSVRIRGVPFLFRSMSTKKQTVLFRCQNCYSTVNIAMKHYWYGTTDRATILESDRVNQLKTFLNIPALLSNQPCLEYTVNSLHTCPGFTFRQEKKFDRIIRQRMGAQFIPYPFVTNSQQAPTPANMKRFKPSVEPVPLPTMPQISNQGLPVIGRHVPPHITPETISQNQNFNERIKQKFSISNTSMQLNNVPQPTQAMPGIPPIPFISTKAKQKWACVEERIQNGLEYGSVIRKIIFGDLYKSPTETVPAENNFNVGDTVYYFDGKKKNLLRGTFITSHTKFQNNSSSKFLVVELLQTENAVEYFCKQYSINYSTRLSMVIEAYTYMEKMIKTPTISNTHVSPTQIINSNPMVFSQPLYRQPSETTLLIEEQDASPERVEVKHESIDDHTVEEIEFEADDDDIPLDVPSNSGKSIPNYASVEVINAQEEISTEKDDNFFVQQKSGDKEEVIVQSVEIAPGDSGGTKKTSKSNHSRHNTNQSNSHHAPMDKNDFYLCAKCDQKLLEPPPNANLNLSRIEIFRNAYAHPKTCPSCPNWNSDFRLKINAERMKLNLYADTAKIQECKQCSSENNCKNKTANICFGCSRPWCKKLNPLVCQECAAKT